MPLTEKANVAANDFSTVILDSSEVHILSLSANFYFSAAQYLHEGSLSKLNCHHMF